MPGSSETQSRLRVALLDADPIRVLGFAAAFEHHPRLHFIPLDMPGLIADLKLSLCIIGLHGNLNIPETLSTLRGLRPDLQILLMGPEASDEEKLSLVSSGAKAYLEETATPEIIEQAIDTVRDGSIWAPTKLLSEFADRADVETPSIPAAQFHLTARERDVLKLLVAARSNREIANSLGIEERTVKAHVAKLMRKVGVDNRIALSVYAVRQAIFTTSDDLGIH
jgi:DNA-binding NarL/FixJ family response regulator